MGNKGMDETNRRQVVDTAYEKLSAEDQIMIDRLAEQLVKGIHKRRGSSGGATILFGRQQALELLAQLGIWMNETSEASELFQGTTK